MFLAINGWLLVGKHLAEATTMKDFQSQKNKNPRSSVWRGIWEIIVSIKTDVICDATEVTNKKCKK